MAHRQPQRVIEGNGHGCIASARGHANGRTASHIKVVVRIRPENKKESKENYDIVVRPMDEHVLIFDPQKQGSPDFYHSKRRTGRDILKRRNKDIKFAFDRVFDMHENNEQVYEQSTKGIIDGLLDGFNSSGTAI